MQFYNDLFLHTLRKHIRGQILSVVNTADGRGVFKRSITDSNAERKRLCYGD